MRYIVTICLAVISLLTNAQGKIFKGTVGKYGIVMCITHNEVTDDVMGWCYYTSQGANKKIALEGSFIQGVYFVDEIVNGEMSGNFTLIFDASNGTFGGTHNKKGRAPLEVSLKYSGEERDSAPQQTGGHLQFMGIPITGALNTFAANLERKGFKKFVSQGSPGWEGKFNGEDVRIALYTTPVSKTVYSVYVSYKQRFNEYQADEKCDALKAIISRKYNTSFTMNPTTEYDIENDYYANIYSDGTHVGIIEVNQFHKIGKYNVNLIYIDVQGFQRYNQEQRQQYNNMDNSDF